MYKVRVDSGGIHLFDRAEGRNILIDEVSPPPDIWTKSPKYVSIALTNVCDLKCRHCYAPKNSQKLEWEQVLHWAISLDESGSFGLGFGGGEPTLFPEFSKLCGKIRNETNLAITMTTHGLGFDSHLLSSLSGNVDFIRLSMDGVRDVYEGMRGKPFTEFESKAIEISKHFRFGINYVVNKATVGDLDRSLEFILKIGARELLLLPQRENQFVKRVDEKTLDTLRLWIEKNKNLIQMSINEEYSGILDSEGVLNQCVPSCHVSSDGMLKNTSYDKCGIKLVNDDIMRAYAELQKTGDIN